MSERPVRLLEETPAERWKWRAAIAALVVMLLLELFALVMIARWVWLYVSR